MKKIQFSPSLPGARAFWRRLKGVAPALTVLTCTTSLASIPDRYPARSLYFSHFRHDFSKGFNLLSVKPIESLREFKSQDVAKMIPSDLTPTSDSGLVATQILDHSLSNFFNSPQVRNSDLGRSTQKIEKNLEGEAAFGGEQIDSTRHVFKFAMRAAQTKAQLQYNGLADAQLVYNIAQNRLDFEVTENFVGSSRLVYNHSATPDENSDILSVRWNW